MKECILILYEIVKTMFECIEYTDSNMKLIKRYLFYFVLPTKLIYCKALPPKIMILKYIIST